MKQAESSDPVITCVLNGHREGALIYPTIRSAKRTIAHTRAAGVATEFLVVLDRADQQTSSIVERELNGFGRVLHVDHGDLGHARNRGVAHSRGDYIGFLDGDDLWCREWIIDAYELCSKHEKDVIVHPEYNIYFGDDSAHTFQHIDMESPEFEFEYLLRYNHWTALSFAAKSTYRQIPFRRNDIADGFGFEDWTWNVETIRKGFLHKTVTGTSHFIRRGKQQESLLDRTNRGRSVPRVLDLYSQWQAA